MKRGSTFFLKLAVILLEFRSGFVLYLLPQIAMKQLRSRKGARLAYMVFGILIVMYVSAIPFYIALYQAFKLLSYIDKNQAFSELSVKALKKIKNCAITISGLYVVILPFVFIMADGMMHQVCINWNGYYWCFNGDRSLCCCSPKTFTRSD